MLVSNTTKYTLFYKAICLLITCILLKLVTFTSRFGNLAIVLLLPYLFTVGHLTMGHVYQLKKINKFWAYRTIIAILVCLIFLYYGNLIFNLWAVYSLTAWHVFSDERFTLKGIQDFLYLEILIPTVVYSNLIYMKFFDQPLKNVFLNTFFVLIFFYFIWLVRQGRRSLIGYYFLIFTILNTIASIYSNYFTLPEIIGFNFYFHCASWYVYYYQKTKGSFIYKRDVLITNCVILIIFIIIILSPNQLDIAKFVSGSFFIPGWLLLHVISTLRGPELKEQHLTLS